MEQILQQEKKGLKAFWPTVVVVGLVCAIVVIAYGMDSAAPGVHDAFHDFRHSIGMPCH